MTNYKTVGPDQDGRMYKIEATEAQFPVERLVNCSHTVTQGREGEKGSWCNGCGVKVFEVDDRQCKDCQHSRQLPDGWICKKHLMAVSPSMNVTYKIAVGTCWSDS